MIVILSYIYIVLGLGYLLIPSIAIELGRPKDLLKGGLFFLLATFLLIKKNTFNNSDLIILLFNNFICLILIAEINLSRWNALSEKEKNSFKNLSEIKNKLLIFFDALKLGNRNLPFNAFSANFFNKNKGKRVWVRSENEEIRKDNKSIKLLAKDSEVTNHTKEDIIGDENN